MYLYVSNIPTSKGSYENIGVATQIKFAYRRTDILSLNMNFAINTAMWQINFTDGLGTEYCLLHRCRGV
jgi:hypothetical protein